MKKYTSILLLGVMTMFSSCLDENLKDKLL